MAINRIKNSPYIGIMLDESLDIATNKPEALKSLYRSPGYKKNQLVLCKNYVLQW
jgi:hypothetical protein